MHKAGISYYLYALVTPADTILSAVDDKRKKIWDGYISRKLPQGIQHTARRKLRMTDSAGDIADLRIPPANRLEKLTGNLGEYYSIRVNNQWRIIFKWVDGHAADVTIVDYHQKK